MAGKDDTRRKQHPVKIVPPPKIKMVPVPARKKSK
jgi:hypothetical protein